MLQFSHIALSVLMVILILLGYQKSLRANILDKKIRKHKFLKLVFGFITWFSYLGVLSYTGILENSSFPPRIPLLLILPFFIFCIYFYHNNKSNPVIQNMPKTWVVYYQTFRILVEVLLLYTFYEGLIPITATFEGLNFDILMGLSAPFMAYFVFSKKDINLFVARAWNILGILMILFVTFIIATSFYAPQLWDSSEILVSFDFLKLPYLLIASFLAPSGIFMHVVSLMQLNGQSNIET